MPPSGDDALVAVPRILVLRAMAVVTAVLVGLGVTVRIYTARNAGELVPASILTIPGEWWPTADDAVEIVGVAGFIGLSFCAATAIILSLAQWNGRTGRRMRVVGLVVGLLLAIGGLVPLILVFMAATSATSGESVGPGMVFYYLGVVGFLVLMSRATDPLRRT